MQGIDSCSAPKREERRAKREERRGKSEERRAKREDRRETSEAGRERPDGRINRTAPSIWQGERSHRIGPGMVGRGETCSAPKREERRAQTAAGRNTQAARREKIPERSGKREEYDISRGKRAEISMK